MATKKKRVATWHSRCSVRQFVDDVINFSSQLENYRFAAKRLRGKPAVFPRYSFNAAAWSPKEVLHLERVRRSAFRAGCARRRDRVVRDVECGCRKEHQIAQSGRRLGHRVQRRARRVHRASAPFRARRAAASNLDDERNAHRDRPVAVSVVTRMKCAARCGSVVWLRSGHERARQRSASHAS